MFTFLIISDFDRIAENVYQVFTEIGTPRYETNGRLLIESSTGMEGGWIAFQPIENIQDDYEMDELAAIKGRIRNPSFFLIEGRDGEDKFSTAFIRKFCPPGRVLIDNDHGVIADLVEIKERIESGTNWLYLSS